LSAVNNIERFTYYVMLKKVSHNQFLYPTWKVMSPYRARSLTAAVRKSARYKFYLEGVRRFG